MRLSLKWNKVAAPQTGLPPDFGDTFEKVMDKAKIMVRMKHECGNERLNHCRNSHWDKKRRGRYWDAWGKKIPNFWVSTQKHFVE